MSNRRCFYLVAATLLNLTAFINPGTQLVTSAQAPTSENWSSWGHDLSNSRYNPAPGGISPQNVAGLKLKWSFVFPGTLSASSQPAIIGNTLYVGSWNAKFYALDARTGRVRWTYDTQSFTGLYPSGLGLLTNAIRTAPAVADGKVYFGDLLGHLYALDAATGAFVWAKKLDPHPWTRLSGSPVVWNGRVYQGVSSFETGIAVLPVYECCTFRGSLVALDGSTGAEVWRYYTVNELPRQTGVSAIGTRQFGPSGAAIWSTPAIDPATGTLYVGTGQNYSKPTTNTSDAVIALDLATGQERWIMQLTPNDRWNVSCSPSILLPLPLEQLPPFPGPNCADANELVDLDWDVLSPNLFTATENGSSRQLVGAPQKSGFYHALDAQTGEIVWQTRLSVSGQGGLSGIQWGGSWDGQRVYVPTNEANPGRLSALDPATGQVLWSSPNPANGCQTGLSVLSLLDCQLALAAPSSSIPGLVFQASLDGKVRAHDSQTGAILWTYDTRRVFIGTNLLVGTGGSIDGAGVSIAHGMVYVNSGYKPYPVRRMEGNVLLAFGL